MGQLLQTNRYNAALSFLGDAHVCRTLTKGLLAARVSFLDGIPYPPTPKLYSGEVSHRIALNFCDQVGPGDNQFGEWRCVKYTQPLWYGRIFDDSTDGSAWRIILVHRWTTRTPGEQIPTLCGLKKADSNINSPDDLRVVSIFFGWVSLVFHRVPDAPTVTAFTCHEPTGPTFSDPTDTASAAPVDRLVFCHDQRLSRLLSDELQFKRPLYPLRRAARELEKNQQESIITSELQQLRFGGRVYVISRIVLGESTQMPLVVPPERIPPVLSELDERQVRSVFAVQIQCANSGPTSWLTVWFYERSVAYTAPSTIDDAPPPKRSRQEDDPSSAGTESATVSDVERFLQEDSSSSE